MKKAKKTQSMICISCPLGCQLKVTHPSKDSWEISGFTCKKGKKYGEQEVTDPRRMVTTTVAIDNALWARLPVRTNEPVPKDLVVDICKELHKLRLVAPVKMGDVVMENVLGTGIPIIATRSLELTLNPEAPHPLEHP